MVPAKFCERRSQRGAVHQYGKQKVTAGILFCSAPESEAELIITAFLLH
jgi:hypothetical protein